MTKILIVEDELLIAQGLARKLVKMGYTVVGIVSSGTDALRQVAQEEPELILMDIVIKGEMDGIEATACIHEQWNIPVIYLTAYADDETLERAQATGAYGYILKPFKEREIHAAIKMALRKHQEALSLAESLSSIAAINEEKSRQLAIAAHDLRNPLATIRMSAEILQEYSNTLSPDKQGECFDRIHGAISSMNELLEDILVLGHTESCVYELSPQAVDIVAFFDGIIHQFMPAAQGTHELQLTAPEHCPIVTLDERLLRHIVLNLVSNALKYSPAGGAIAIRVIHEPHQLTFSVTDSGIGIPPDYYQLLFHRFRRASNVGEIRGTGLGLSIVKQAVDLHHGEIWVDSEVGKGTCFTVVLPCDEGLEQGP
jgi:signal transduction histidine kinase